MEALPAALPALSRYQKFLVTLLALVQFTVVLDFMVLAPLGAVLMKSLHVTPANFSLVVSAYAFSAGVSGVLAAGFADCFDRKKLLLFFYTGFMVGTLGCALAGSYPLLLAARIVAGLFGGVIGSVVLTIVTDEFAPHQRGRAMGAVQLALAGSQVLGIPLALYLSNRWDWHAPFGLIAGLTLLLGGTVLVWMRPLTTHLQGPVAPRAFSHLGHTLRTKQYQTGLLAIALLSFGGFLLMPFGSTYLLYNVHLRPSQLPLLYLCTGLSSLVVMPVVGRLSDRFSKFRLFAFGSALALVLVVVYTNLGPTPLWQVIGLNIVLFAGITSRMVPAMTLNTSVPALPDRGAYLSLTASVQQLGGGLAAVGAGLVVRQATATSPLVYYNVLGYVAAGVFGGCMYFVYWVSRQVASK